MDKLPDPRKEIILFDFSKYAFGFFFSVWLIFRLFKNLVPESYFELFSDTYGVVAFFGGLSGLFSLRLWGGLKSFVGRALLFFSAGLLFQFLGQISYAYYRRVLGIEVPYPSFGEIFYFGSIPIYILGVWQLLKATTNKSTFKSIKNKTVIFSIPLLMIFIAFELFLRDYDYSDTTPLVVFLDFGYPILQAIQVSMAVLTFFLSRNLLGGALKKPIFLLLLALFVQYFADLYYTFRVINETFESGGVSDLLYLISYFIMAFALYSFLPAYKKIKEVVVG